MQDDKTQRKPPSWPISLDILYLNGSIAYHHDSPIQSDYYIPVGALSINRYTMRWNCSVPGYWLYLMKDIKFTVQHYTVQLVSVKSCTMGVYDCRIQLTYNLFGWVNDTNFVLSVVDPQVNLSSRLTSFLECRLIDVPGTSHPLA